MIIRYFICFGILCMTSVLKASNFQYSNGREPVVSSLEQSSPDSELLLGTINENQTIERNEIDHQNSLNEHELKKIQNLITSRRQNPQRRWVLIMVVIDISCIKRNSATDTSINVTSNLFCKNAWTL